MTKPKSTEWLSAMDMASRLGVSTATLTYWRSLDGFPEHAYRRPGLRAEWNLPAMLRWLRSRPVGGRGPVGGWWHLIHGSKKRGDVRAKQSRTKAA